MEQHPYGLTPSEWKLLLLVCTTGGSAKALARRMSLSPNTIKSQLLHIRNKMGVTSVLQAVVKAYREALIDHLP